MIELITNIIDKLDAYEDMFLIGLLNQKVDNLNEDYKLKHSISSKEYNQASVGVDVIIKNHVSYATSNDEKCIKSKKILNRTSNCDVCKFSISRQYTHHIFGFSELVEYKVCDETKRCNRCEERSILFSDICDIYRKPKIENYKEITECKTIISKINKKIKSLKKNNYEAS